MSFDENNYRKIYEYIDCTTNTEEIEINGKETICLRTGFAMLRPVLVDIEAMAREIESNRDSVRFKIKTDPFYKLVVVPEAKIEKKIMRYFYNLNTFFVNYNNLGRYVFSPHVQAVSDALASMGLHPYDFRFREPNTREIATGKTHGQIFNEFTAKLSDILTSSDFKERLRARKRNAERNEAKGLAIEKRVFEHRSRQLVLMLHLGYQEEHRSKITLEEIQTHRKKFFNNSRSNKLLRGIVDYIWKFEEGNESGLHLHMLIFYTADSCRDVYIARQIGEYWIKITEGRGQYWNSNANKSFHLKYGHGVGTGEIDWNDEAKREALRTNIRYMTKADQFLKMKYGKHCHLFGTSEVAEKKRAGRPRRALAMVDSDVAGSTQ